MIQIFLADGTDGTDGRDQPKVVQEVLADLKIKQPVLPVSVRPICPAQSTQELILNCFKLNLRISIAWINFFSFARATS